MSALLIAEHNNKEVKPFTLNAITAASQIDTDVLHHVHQANSLMYDYEGEETDESAHEWACDPRHHDFLNDFPIDERRVVFDFKNQSNTKNSTDDRVSGGDR